MFFIPIMYLDQNRLQKTEQEINRITLRGYNESCRPDADLSKYRIGVHLLADYCPTDRYIYITKKMPEIALEETWNGLQGRLIEKVYTESYESASKLVIRASLRNLTFKRWLSSTARKIIKTREKEIDQARDSLRRKPRPNEVKSFANKLKILADYELCMFASYMQFLVSKKFNINIKTEFRTYFDFIFKHALNGSKIGLTDSVQPDFIYLRKIVGDIKTGDWQEFFRVMIAAYAMAYEASENTDMNCGIVLNPTFHSARKVPLYKSSEIFVIDDVLRKAFLAKRDQKLRILREETLPQKPSDGSRCKDCGYFTFCWGEV